jgi:hypothetical protein
MNNHILPKTGGSNLLKTLTPIYQIRRRRFTESNNIYIYHRDNLKYYNISPVLILALSNLLPDIKMI